MRFYQAKHMHYLGRLTAAVASLEAQPGDWLRFLPTGPAAANLTLQRAAESKRAAAEQASRPPPPPPQQQQPQGQAVETGHPLQPRHTELSSDCSSLSGQPPSKRRRGSPRKPLRTAMDQEEEQPQEMQQQPAVSSPQQQKPQHGHGTIWQGLDPTDLRCYTAPLPAMSVGKHHKLTLPGEREGDGQPAAVANKLFPAPRT